MAPYNPHVYVQIHAHTKFATLHHVFNSLLTVQAASADSIISATASIYSVTAHPCAAYARLY